MQKHAVHNGLQSLVYLVELVVLFEDQRIKCAHKFCRPGLSYRTCWCPLCHPKPSPHRRCWMSRFFGQGPGGVDMKHWVHSLLIPLWQAKEHKSPAHWPDSGSISVLELRPCWWLSSPESHTPVLEVILRNLRLFAHQAQEANKVSQWHSGSHVLLTTPVTPPSSTIFTKCGARRAVLLFSPRPHRP